MCQLGQCRHPLITDERSHKQRVLRNLAQVRKYTADAAAAKLFDNLLRALADSFMALAPCSCRRMVIYNTKRSTHLSHMREHSYDMLPIAHRLPLLRPMYF